MIKKFEHFNMDIDPYGEEDWNEYPPVLQIAQKTGKPFNQITELYCPNKQLTNLEGIENLVNLKVFSCSNNQLTSLEGIENLVNLTDLYCYGNQLTSLDGIENLVNLRRLSCSYNQLTNLDGIENLVNLRRLYCFNNRFSNDYKNYLKSLKIKYLKL